MSVMIEMERINRIFPIPGGTFQTLKDIDAQIEAGTFTILKGRSGSGKTTLLNIIGALDLPTSGRICMEGKDLTAMSEYDREELRRKQMGFVFQAVSLIPTMNAFQNVEFSMRLSGVKSPRERQERVEECLKMVGLGNRMTHMPAEMSGGEQQRIAIAIALANSPQLLLADEPTGSVDTKTADYIFDVFTELNKEGQTILIVTHDVALSRKVKRVVAIRDGKISSERVLKEKYADRLKESNIDWHTEETQEEFAIVDKVGRVQIPSELLKEIGLKDNKVSVTVKDGQVVLSRPQSTEENAKTKQE